MSSLYISCCPFFFLFIVRERRKAVEVEVGVGVGCVVGGGPLLVNITEAENKKSILDP